MRGGKYFFLFGPLAHSWSQLLTFRWKKCTGVTLSKIIPKSHISHGVLGLFFLMSRYAGITFYYSEVCWWGSTLKASPILLTWKCSSHHIGMHFFDIATSKSAPTLSVFTTFECGIQWKRCSRVWTRLWNMFLEEFSWNNFLRGWVYECARWNFNIMIQTLNIPRNNVVLE